MFSKLKTLSRTVEAKNPTARFDRDGNITIRTRVNNAWQDATVDTPFAADVFALQHGYSFWVVVNVEGKERKQQRFALTPVDQDMPEKPQDDAREIQLLPIYSAEIKKLTGTNRADLIVDEKRTSHALVAFCDWLETEEEFAAAIAGGQIPICHIGEDAEDTEFGIQPDIEITDFVDRPKSMGPKLLNA